MRLQKSLYNLFFSLFSQIITLGLGIIIPRLFLMNFGSELNGLISSIGQVFACLSLLEAGIGTTTTQALYKPIVENNKEKINEILSASNDYYKKMGKIYILAVVVFAFVYPIFIHSSINKLTVILIILFSGMGGAINFFLQNKYTVLLVADGRSYVMTNINMILSVCINLSKVTLIILGFNIIAIQLSQFVITLIRIGILNIYMKRNYGWINFKAKKDYNSISQSSNVLIHQISYLIFSNTDILVLTIFCKDLKIISVYVIYNMIIGFAEGIISAINNSVSFAYGQIYNENINRFIKLFDFYEVMYMVFSFSVYICIYYITIPFLKIYTAGINDINYIDKNLLFIFIIMKLLMTLRSQSFMVINIVGHFKLTQTSAIIEATINLIFSIILVNIIGIYGVVLGTISGLIYRCTYCVWYANSRILNRNPIITFKRWMINIIIFIVFGIIYNKVNIVASSYFDIIKYSIILGLIVLAIVFLINLMFNKYIFSDLITIIKTNYKLSNKKIGDKVV